MLVFYLNVDHLHTEGQVVEKERKEKINRQVDIWIGR